GPFDFQLSTFRPSTLRPLRPILSRQVHLVGLRHSLAKPSPETSPPRSPAVSSRNEPPDGSCRASSPLRRRFRDWREAPSRSPSSGDHRGARGSSHQRPPFPFPFVP